MNKLFFLSFISCVIFGNNSFTQFGTPDTSFGTDGKVTTAIGTGNDDGYAMIILPDDKILVAAETSNGSDMDFALVRYNSNGSLDNSFGSNGIQVTPLGLYNDLPRAIAIEPGGKIIVTGCSYNSLNSDFAIARFNSNGSLDNSFGLDGKYITAIGVDNDYANSVWVQDDGKIIVGGYAYMGIGQNYDFALMRFNNNGLPDSTFGTNGILTTEVGTSDDVAHAISIQTDGKILLGGWSSNSGSPDFSLVRYQADGSLDKSFGTNGKIITPVGNGNDQGKALVVQPDGKILQGGSSFTGTNTDFALVRFNANGTLDSSFNSDGKVTTNFSSYEDVANCMSLQPDGKILVAGQAAYITDIDFGLVCYNSNGTLDHSFGNGGKITTSFTTYPDFARAIAIQQDGKIVLSGCYQNNSDYDLALARYNSEVSVEITNNYFLPGEELFTTQSVMVYPNPAHEYVILKYLLKKEEKISIQLFDTKGNLTATYLDQKKQVAGVHEESIHLSDKLPVGSYFIVVSTNSGTNMGIQLTKY